MISVGVTFKNNSMCFDTNAGLGKETTYNTSLCGQFYFQIAKDLCIEAFYYMCMVMVQDFKYALHRSIVRWILSEILYINDIVNTVYTDDPQSDCLTRG